MKQTLDSISFDASEGGSSGASKRRKKVISKTEAVRIEIENVKSRSKLSNE